MGRWGQDLLGNGQGDALPTLAAGYHCILCLPQLFVWAPEAGGPSCHWPQIQAPDALKRRVSWNLPKL